MQGFSNFLGLFQVIVANPEIEKERKKERKDVSFFLVVYLAGHKTVD